VAIVDHGYAKTYNAFAKYSREGGHNIGNKMTAQ